MRNNRKIERKYIIILIIIIIMVSLIVLSYGLKRKEKLNIVESFIKDAIVSI